MGRLAERAPTVITVCTAAPIPGGRGLRYVRRTIRLLGREAVFVESLARLGRDGRLHEPERPARSVAELR